LSIFLIGLGGPRDEAIQAKFACSSSASQAHGSPGSDELTFEQLAEDHRIRGLTREDAPGWRTHRSGRPGRRPVRFH